MSAPTLTEVTVTPKSSLRAVVLDALNDAYWLHQANI